MYKHDIYLAEADMEFIYKPANRFFDPTWVRLNQVHRHRRRRIDLVVFECYL